MKNVIITSGAYGLKQKDAKHVTAITRADGPISITDEEAERIVKLGVAEYVEDIDGETDDSEEHLDVDDLMKMTKDNMKKLAEDMGVDISGADTKAEIAALIAAVPVEPGDDDENQPDLGAEDPQA